jgi:hypothetical protein
MRKIFGAKREEVAENWRKMLNDALRLLFSTKYFSGLRIQEE